MTDFKPEVNTTSNLPRGFRPVRLNLNNINQFNQPNEVIYDEPCSNYDSNYYQQQPSIPPPIPSSQPPTVSSNLNNGYNSNNNFNSQNTQPIAQPFWTLPQQEQQQLQQHLQEHISRSPTPTFGQSSSVNADNIQKVITDKEPPSNAEFLYETDAYKFYTVPKSNEKKIVTKIKQQTNRQEIQGIGPLNEAGVPLTLRTGVNNRHKSDWYKTMFKNMHITDKPKWDEPVKVKKNKKARKEKLDEPIQNEYIYDNHPPINQYQSFQENERRKKETLQREMEKEWGYVCDEPETKYIIKKKKTSKSKSPVSRKTYAMVQKGEDIPLSGLGKPAPKSKNKGFYDQKQKEQANLISRSPSPRHESRSPTPILTYPASDYVPERPPTPQYSYSQHQQINQYNELNTQYSNQYNYNQFNNQTTLQPTRQIYNQQVQQQKSTITTKNKKTDFTAIDEWQRKMKDDFNQIYSNLERNFEIKRLRETGKLVSPVPPSENRKETGFRARDLYLDQQSMSPKPPSRAKYYLEPSKPLYANDLFNENSYKTTTTTTNKYNTINTSRDWLDSTNKLNRFNSSQELNYLNPNNNRQFIDFNNNTIDNKSTFKKSIYQHNSLDNLNTLSNYEQPVHQFNYKIFAQPETTRTYTESTCIVDSNTANPVIDHKTRTTTNTFQFQRQNSILDIERQLNETLGDLLRSTSSCCDNRNESRNDFKRESPIIKTIKIDNLSNITKNVSARNITRPKSPPIRQDQQAIDKELAKLAIEQQNFQQNFTEQSQQQQPVEEEEIKPIEIKAVPFNLQPNQDVNNISFQTTEDDVDLDKLIKKIELDAALEDEIDNN